MNNKHDDLTPEARAVLINVAMREPEDPESKTDIMNVGERVSLEETGARVYHPQTNSFIATSSRTPISESLWGRGQRSMDGDTGYEV